MFLKPVGDRYYHVIVAAAELVSSIAVTLRALGYRLVR
jgi:hypothetical protein